MREPLIAVSVGLVIVAACVSVAPYGAAPAGAQASNTLYCWKDRLVDESDKLVCNWAASRYDACNGHIVTYLEKRLVTRQPSAATRCENGQSLVSVTTG
ncbi:MAG TPA: hypothetical protein VFE23_06765 [Usitatibacter sp.]|jgi:hypothetical protein|nr:hypothetical protein [Usitatibacter sp.]